MKRPPTAPAVVLLGLDTARTHALADELRRGDHPVVVATNDEEIRSALEHPLAGLLIDLEPPGLHGMEVLLLARAGHPHACAVVLVPAGEEERGLEAMARGADDFLVHPASIRKFDLLLARAHGRKDLTQRARALQANLADLFAYERIVGESLAMARVRDELRRAAQTGRRVLFLGERGTGKELCARVLHQNGATAAGPFIVADPASLRFAEERGGCGTVFVDGIDEPTDAARQALGRYFGPSSGEESVGPRGVVRGHRITGSALAAPAGLVDQVEVLTIHLPPLRERTGDVPLLVDHFLRAHNREHGRRVTGLTRGALAHLEAWTWPGNVRELKATLEGMVVFIAARRPLDVSDLPLALRDHAPGEPGEVTFSLGISLAEAEKSFLEEILRSVGYDRARAAETLGIGLRTLYRKLKEYEIG